MAYNAKETRKSVKSDWRMRAADFEAGEPAEVIRSYGEPDKKRQLENGSVMSVRLN